MNQLALVTGSSAGIGLELAKQLAAPGIRLPPAESTRCATRSPRCTWLDTSRL